MAYDTLRDRYCMQYAIITITRELVNGPARESFLSATRFSFTDSYVVQNPCSHDLYHREQISVPGGSTRGAVFYPPFPVYADHGEDCTIVDVDGNDRVDFMGNYTSLVLGHCHPAVTSAVMDRVRTGPVLGTPSHDEIRLAEALIARLPSLERIIFTTTGSEAVLAALRAARAFTGRSVVAKIEGGYHGSYDWVKVSGKPELAKAGPASRPIAVPDSEGIPDAVLDQVIVLPFNDHIALEEIMAQRGHEISAIIIEPILGSGGMIPASSEFLQRMRQLTADHGALLIFDEIITQRLGPGGAQERYGIYPDLTLLAKGIGGGFPIGAVGGREEVMEVFDNSRLHPRVYHSGTFNANALSVRAGLATLKQLTPDTYDHLNRLGDMCREELTCLFNRIGAPFQVVGAGSLFNIHATLDPIDDYRSVCTRNPVLQHELFLGLLTQGIYLASRGMGCISAPMNEHHVAAFVSATAYVLDRLGYS